MKNIKFLLLTLISSIILTGCAGSTTSGGDNSVTNNNYTYDYQFSNKTQSEINSSQKTIVITEMLGDNTYYTSDIIAAQKTNFINSVKNKMENVGYKLISSDSGNIGETNSRFIITLIFERDS